MIYKTNCRSTCIYPCNWETETQPIRGHKKLWNHDHTRQMLAEDNQIISVCHFLSSWYKYNMHMWQSGVFWIMFELECCPVLKSCSNNPCKVNCSWYLKKNYDLVYKAYFFDIKFKCPTFLHVQVYQYSSNLRLNN